MKRLNLWLVLLTTFAGCTPSENSNVDLTQYVNPMIGTDFTGNTYPGAQLPFGMVQLSPDNGLPGWDRISGYFYPDSTIAGFSHTHLSGTGAGDLYDISFIGWMHSERYQLLHLLKKQFQSSYLVMRTINNSKLVDLREMSRINLNNSRRAYYCFCIPWSW